jgi:hypothetical protein
MYGYLCAFLERGARFTRFARSVFRAWRRATGWLGHRSYFYIQDLNIPLEFSRKK